MGQQSFLPEIDRKKTQAAVEAALEKYRINKFLTYEDREATTTTAWSNTPKGFTGVISDQTANIAIYNVDSQAARKEYCERIERVVGRMPKKEALLIKERYMTIEYDYITDQRVYSFIFDPPISEPTYSKIRWRAFYKLASDLRLIVTKGDGGDGREKD
ncbi:ArpU family phage packaging/lysis transcriptional regulator [Paenibacillus graminis]|uniref:Transcriptional regulator n=1 Tax=Paenibacillus graminis TaxID=189425 RepID=A0A089MDE6_9BACL|nr:ArpU family phage packaging/lysis transcriptional regulator [Paenibacillus graminis]AIQ69483.1 transcriptional regulator [Paenibacillus graminis]